MPKKTETDATPSSMDDRLDDRPSSMDDVAWPDKIYASSCAECDGGMWIGDRVIVVSTGWLIHEDCASAWLEANRHTLKSKSKGRR